MKKICVIGSLNIDLTAIIPRFNNPGETIFGLDFKTYTGGKGGNQAVAASKLGADVTMVGKLGQDSNAEIYRTLMEDHGIRDCVETSADAPSGVALIEVEKGGENRIIVISGANMQVDREQIDRCLDKILECDVTLFQLEIPLDTVCYAAEKIHQAGKIVILDPAPAPTTPLPDELLRNVDYLTPNETELSTLCGCGTQYVAEAVQGARRLISRGVKNVIAKQGSRGAMIVNAEGVVNIPGFKVNAVDTTAAGDSFNAGLGVALSMGMLLPDAVRFANAVGAISVTGVGAQSAMPSMEEANRLLNL